MKIRLSKYGFALAHSEDRTKPYVYFQKAAHITECAKRSLYKCSFIKPVWSNYSLQAACGPPQGFQWLVEAFRKIFKFEIC